jgi:hypothetical protein
MLKQAENYGVVNYNVNDMNGCDLKEYMTVEEELNIYIF